MNQVVREYAKEVKTKMPNKDLLNDIALGISRAIELNKDYINVLKEYGLEYVYRSNMVEFNSE